jgi:intracellular sulfur oxidation DsrE/DsrF family protein
MYAVGAHGALVFLAALAMGLSARTAAGSEGIVCWLDSACDVVAAAPKASASGDVTGASTRAKGKPTAKKAAHKTAAAPAEKRQTPAPITHKVAIQIDERDAKLMDLALNNARNVIEYYQAKAETVVIQVVAYGPGLHMLREDISPVKERIASMSLQYPNLSFVACANTQANQSTAEGKPVLLLSEARITPSGVVRLVELQTRGYAYIRP